MIHLYSFFVFLCWPLIFLAFVIRYGWRMTWNGMGERWGSGGAVSGKGRPLWVHAASVGEVKAVEPLLKGLREKYPDVPVALTTSTVNGRELARRMNLAKKIVLSPVDLPFAVKRLLLAWNPRALVIMETEIWPNWIHTLMKYNIPIYIINGRLSDRSYRSYRLSSFFWRPLLSSLAGVGAQNALYRDRFAALGVPAEKAVVMGNLKNDLALPDPKQREGLCKKYGLLPQNAFWVCGSTRDQEESPLLETFQILRQEAKEIKMILAPRHIERVPELKELLERMGLSFVQRSSGEPLGSRHVLLLDTIGELAEVYGVASWCFVGGSLVPKGGQNPFEPVRWGAPLVFGPSMENFKDATQALLEGKGAVQVKNQGALLAQMQEWLAHPEKARQVGDQGRRVVQSQQGGQEKAFTLLQTVLSSRG